MLDHLTPVAARATTLVPLRLPVIASAALIAVATDVGVRGDLANGATALALTGLVVLLLVTGAVAQRGARVLLLVALLPIGMLAVRVSPWLTASNLALVAALIGTAVLYARSGSFTRATPSGWARRLVPAWNGALDVGDDTAQVVGQIAASHGHRTGQVVRATAIALPFVTVTVVLLTRADAVFAGLVLPDIDLATGITHVLVVASALVMTVVVQGVARRIDAIDDSSHGEFGTLEATTMLALAAAALGAFVVAQLVALTDAGDRFVREAGFTPAEYARSGFFELCWAAVAITVLLTLVRRRSTPETMQHGPVRILNTVVPLLTLGLVVVSLRRMALYDEAFGLTMLRLWAVGAIVAIGVVLLAIALRNALRPNGRGIAGVALVTAIVLIVGADIANPEAFVVRHNAARDRQGATVDFAYLATLSDDAVPQLATTFAPRPWLVRQLVDCRAHGISRANLNVLLASATRHTACTTPR